MTKKFRDEIREPLTREDKIRGTVGLVIVIVIVAALTYSCSGGGGNEGSAPKPAATSAAPTTTSTAPATTKPYDPAVGVEYGEDIPDCDAKHGKTQVSEYVDGHGLRTLCRPDRDGDGRQDADDDTPDLHNDQDADGDGHTNSIDDYPHDASRYSQFEETYTPDSGGSDSGSSNPFSCGPGDIDGDGDGRCNEG